MLLSCPFCGERISAKPPEPGRHKPRCPKCRTKFLLIVPADPRETYQVRKLPESDERGAGESEPTA